MTQLKTLRRNLSALRRRRRGVRWLTAYSALISAVIWAIVGIFAVDVFFFEVFKVALDAPQRIILIVIGATTTFAVFYFLTRPLIGVRETMEDMALLVERNQRIDSDLIAALQFESPDAATWGSRQLETAVIQYVAKAGRGLNVFDGFSVDQLVRRSLILLISAGVFVGLHIAWPNRMNVFWHRLALSARHYPTDTVIQHIVLNNETVFAGGGYSAQPDKSVAPQGQPLDFTIMCRGDLPETGTVRFTSIGGGRHEFQIGLVRLSNEQRLARLRKAERRIEQAISDPGIDLKGPWRQELATLVGFDAPQTVEMLKKASQDRSKLPSARDNLKSSIAAWQKDDDSALYLGTLDRFVDPLSYTVHLGDAWTDRASVEMIPLPIVQPHLKITPPGYARSSTDDRVDSSARQISVLEGSRVDISLDCTNQKRLVEAWVVMTSGENSLQLPFSKNDTSGAHWSLDVAGTSLETIESDLRFEIQVEDEDGLHLESALQGYIRIRPDRPPAGTIHWVHKLALPTARLSLDYNISDDFGIERLILHTQVERNAARSLTTVEEPGTELSDSSRRSRVVAAAQPAERLAAGQWIEHDGRTIKIAKVALDAAASDDAEGGCNVAGTALDGQSVQISLRKRQLVRVKQPVLKSVLPLEGQCEVDLSPLGLEKGDRLKVELEIVDYRGVKPGKSTRSDSLVLEITDESGVLAAVSEADERSEQQLSDIIKRQLGIGESP